MDSPDGAPMVTEEIRARIRSRARQLRTRRRLRVATGVLGVVAIGCVGALIGKGRPAVRVAAGSADSCPAATAKVTVAAGERAELTVLPPGFVLRSGDPEHLESGVEPTYAPAGAGPNAAKITLQHRLDGLPPAAVFGGIHESTLVKVTPVEVDGASGALEEISNKVPSPGGGPSGQVSVAWTIAPNVTLVLRGSGLDTQAMLAAARGAHYTTGPATLLPLKLTTSTTAEAAIGRLPGPAVRARHAVLTTLNEALHAAPGPTPGRGALQPRPSPLHSLADVRAVWLVWEDAQPWPHTWAIVDAHTGNLVDIPRNDSAPWLTAVTDRRTPGCNPPPGIFTRSEITMKNLGPNPPSTFTLKLTTLAALPADNPLSRSPLLCGSCRPDTPLWVATDTSTAPPSTRFMDAVSGNELVDVRAPIPSSITQLQDLAPQEQVTASAALGSTGPVEVISGTSAGRDWTLYGKVSSPGEHSTMVNGLLWANTGICVGIAAQPAREGVSVGGGTGPCIDPDHPVPLSVGGFGPGTGFDTQIAFGVTNLNVTTGEAVGRAGQTVHFETQAVQQVPGYRFFAFEVPRPGLASLELRDAGSTRFTADPATLPRYPKTP